MEAFIALLPIAIPLLFVLVGWISGHMVEKNHYASIRQREGAMVLVPVVNFKTLPDNRRVGSATLAEGSIVISIDAFKKILLAFRMFFGGESAAMSSLLDRARREALLRMREAHPNADLFINFRFEYSTISGGSKNGNSVKCVEVLAYSTAIQYAY